MDLRNRAFDTSTVSDLHRGVTATAFYVAVVLIGVAIMACNSALHVSPEELQYRAAREMPRNFRITELDLVAPSVDEHLFLRLPEKKKLLDQYTRWPIDAGAVITPKDVSPVPQLDVAALEVIVRMPLPNVNFRERLLIPGEPVCVSGNNWKSPARFIAFVDKGVLLSVGQDELRILARQNALSLSVGQRKECPCE